MKTASTKTTFRILTLSALISGFFFTSSCSKDNSETESAAIVTYSGTVKMGQGASSYDDHLDLSFTKGSTRNGTFFRKSDGAVGLFSGTETDGALNVSGTIKDNSSISFSGKIKISNNTLSIDITFLNSYGTIPCIGTLSKVDCIDISGNYYVYESYKLAITADGATDTLIDSGYGYITLDQTDCQIIYTVPGTDATREGNVDGNKFVISGVCMLPASGVTYTQNSFSAEVTIIDNNHFEYVSTMKAKGSYQGHSFTVKGSSNGTFSRLEKSHSLSGTANSHWLQTMPEYAQNNKKQVLAGSRSGWFFDRILPDLVLGVSSYKNPLLIDDVQ